MAECSYMTATNSYGGTYDDSILDSIKKLLGIDSDYTYFDRDLILHINGALARLSQATGLSPNFSIRDASAKWSDYTGGREDVDNVVNYVHGRVRLRFDLPQNSFLVNAIEKDLDELIWCLNVQVETPCND